MAVLIIATKGVSEMSGVSSSEQRSQTKAEVLAL
jgi:hypothetical protein